MFTKKSICQSCGMSLKEEGGGTDKNGTISTEYCATCYFNGAFTNPHISMLEMREEVKDKLQQYGIPSILRTHFTRGIPKLTRWNNSK